MRRIRRSRLINRLAGECAGQPNSLTRALKAMGYHKIESHEVRTRPVPDCFDGAASREIQGLCDNDGTISKDGIVVEYNTTSPKLAQDVLALVRSLGGSAWISTRIPTYTVNGERKQGRLNSQDSMSLPDRIAPFRVAKKRDRYKPRSKYPPIHAFASIEPNGVEGVCASKWKPPIICTLRETIFLHTTRSRRSVPSPTALRFSWSLPRWPRACGSVRRHGFAPTSRSRFCGAVEASAGRLRARWWSSTTTFFLLLLRRKTARALCLTHPFRRRPRVVWLSRTKSTHARTAGGRRTRAFRAIADAVRALETGRVWLLTATPILNRPPELYSVLRAAGLERQAFGTWEQFVRLFGGETDSWGAMTWGSPDASVPERLARVSLRRDRAAVLPQLPTKPGIMWWKSGAQRSAYATSCSRS